LCHHSRQLVATSPDFLDPRAVDARFFRQPALGANAVWTAMGAMCAQSGPMALIAGVDCSTQSTKVVVRDAATGKLARESRADHPPGTEVHPEVWWRALEAATRGGLLDGVAAIAVGGQQHGMVALDERGEVVRPAILWNDTRSAAAAEALVVELGGPGAWAAAVGTVPVASITVTKLRWLGEHEPQHAERVAAVALPHDWVTWMLAGGPGPPGAAGGAGRRDQPGSRGRAGRTGDPAGAWPATDRGDASGTGYWSPASGTYRTDLVELAFGRTVELPRVLAPSEPAGTTAATSVAPAGALLGPGTGDNMAAVLGVGAVEGDVVVSIGTSGTVFAVHPRPTADPTGAVAGFADATGRFLPLVCTLNAARVLEAAARLLGTDLDGVDRLALQASPGAGGMVLLPYLEGERTPNRPVATGVLAGMRDGNATPSNLARAAVEGMLCGLADGLDALRAVGVGCERILLVGGAARSRAVGELAPAILGAPVTVPPPGEYVADGAAMQAAWILEGGPEPPAWSPAERIETFEADPQPQVRARYAELREAAPELAR
jgi:xylulokinase